MGPGLETVLAQILGEALELPTRSLRGSTHRHGDGGERHWDLRLAWHGHAGNAAHLAAGKLVAEARGRAAELWGVSFDVIKYEGGELGAGGQRITIGELAARKRLATGASFSVPKVTYAGCGVAVIADIDADTRQVRLRRVVVGADVGVRSTPPR